VLPFAVTAQVLRSWQHACVCSSSVSILLYGSTGQAALCDACMVLRVAVTAQALRFWHARLCLGHWAFCFTAVLA
jgi:hypothetical protein